jgi:hypothetical protein
MRLSKKVSLLLTSISLATAVAIAAPTIYKPSDIAFHPAPGFPKGAQIVLLKGDLSKAEPYTIRFKLPAGFVILSHWHDKDESNTVLSGTLNVGMGDKVDKSASTALTAGSYQVVPAMIHHYVWASEEAVFQIDGMGPRTTTFVNPDEWTALIKNSNK